MLNYIFSDGLGINLLWQGALIAVLTLISYVIGAQTSATVGTTMAFLTLSVCEMLHAWNMRSLNKSIFSMKSHNKLLNASILLSFILTDLIIFIPTLRNIFSLAEISIVQFLLAAAVAAMIVPVVEMVKAIQRDKK